MKQILLAFFLLLTLFSLGASALAEEMQILSLPANLKQIEDEAFYADASLEKVVLPEGTVQIGSRAFADSSLKEIELPYSLETIADDAFSGCEGLVAYALDGSYAQEYCARNNITCLPLALPASDFAYKLNEDGASWILTRYRGTAEDVVIPGIIEGKPVTTLSSLLFYTKDNIRSVHIPNTVNLIEPNALSHCPNLQKVVLPKGLKTIPSFYGCSNLEEIAWPENYTSFSGFGYCLKLKSFRIPDGMTEVPGLAFVGCTGLTEVEIPDSVTVIRDRAFLDCTALETIEIPEGVTEIEFQTFMNCTSLKSLVIPLNCDLSEYDIFENCPALTVQVVGNSTAEDYCRRYKVNYVAVGETSIDHLFETATLEDGGCEITKFVGTRYFLEIPASIRGEQVRSVGYEAFVNNDILRSVTFPEGLTAISSRAFHQCINLASVDFPSSLVSIGDSAFARDRSLKEAILPQSAVNLGASVFSGCSELTQAVLPDSITEISNYLFSGCDKLESIDIPAGVKRIGNYAFQNCDLLQPPVLPEGLEEIGDYAFQACPAFNELTFPQSLVKIGNYAYAYCKNLYLAVVPASVTEVGNGAFREDTALTMVTERGSAALKYCKDDSVFFIIEPNAQSDFRTSKISSTACRIIGYTGTDVDVFLPETIGGLTVESVYSSAFKDNKKIESISILNSVNSIGSKAFMNCTALRYAAISDGVTSIAENAFDGCTNLEKILVVSLVGE